MCHKCSKDENRRCDGRLSQFAKFAAAPDGQFHVIGWAGGNRGVQWSEGYFATTEEANSHIKKVRGDPSSQKWQSDPLTNFFVFDDHGRYI
jgi:hypothetical protein